MYASSASLSPQLSAGLLSFQLFCHRRYECPFVPISVFGTTQRYVQLVLRRFGRQSAKQSVPGLASPCAPSIRHLVMLSRPLAVLSSFLLKRSVPSCSFVDLSEYDVRKADYVGHLRLTYQIIWTALGFEGRARHDLYVDYHLPL
jgi:hypothetical protein